MLAAIPSGPAPRLHEPQEERREDPSPLVDAWPETFGPGTDEGFDEIARQLKEYLAGGRRAFDLPL
jgi:hypothetical protein